MSDFSSRILAISNAASRWPRKKRLAGNFESDSKNNGSDGGFGASVAAALNNATAATMSPATIFSLPISPRDAAINSRASFRFADFGNVTLNFCSAATRSLVLVTVEAFSHSVFSSGLFAAAAAGFGFVFVVNVVEEGFVPASFGFDVVEAGAFVVGFVEAVVFGFGFAIVVVCVVVCKAADLFTVAPGFGFAAAGFFAVADELGFLVVCFGFAVDVDFPGVAFFTGFVV